MKITRIQITDFRGLSTLVVEPGAGGAVIKGQNGKGKTSVLRAISAALSAEGVGPDAIRIGADKAEILVDLDALKIRRAITKKGSTLTLSNSEGATYNKPQGRLDDLLGSTLDPLAFYLAKPAERRKMILEAIPLRVTQGQIEAWIGCSYMMPGIESAHGLEVLAKIRADFYARRTEANATAKAAKIKAEGAAVQSVPEGPDLETAEKALRDADRALERLHIQRANAEGARKATAAQRARAEELRRRAGTMLGEAPAPPPEDEVEPAAARLNAAQERVVELKAKLADAETELKEAQAAARSIDKRIAAADKALEDATKLTNEADTIEATLTEMMGTDVSEEDILLAAAALDEATRARALAAGAAKAREANLAAESLRREAEAAAARAAALDAVVDTLTNQAPAELARSPDMIPGLGFTEDAITLDGKAIDDLCGAEQLRLAVEIARRANAKAKILVVDGLERLDSAGMEEFVGLATKDGWQLLATRVTEGDLVVEAIEPDVA